MPGWMKWTVSMLIGLGVIVLGWRLSDNRWGWWVLPTFFVINCLFLIIVVLLQSGKAADIAGAFGGAGSQTAFGPRGAATLLSRATTWCAVMFMICALALVLHTDKTLGRGGSSVLEKVAQPASKKAPATTPAPAAPTPQPTSAPATQIPAAAPAASQPASGQQPPPQQSQTPPKKP